MNIGYAPFVGVDVRARTCARCQRQFTGRGGDGMCSGRCWVATRGRQQSQTEALSRSLQAIGDRQDRRILGGVRVSRLLADAALDSAIERYKRNRHATRELIERAQARSRGEAVRSAPEASCAKCEAMGASPREIAQICAHRGAPGRVPARSEPAGHEAIRVTTYDDDGRLGSYAPGPVIYR